MSRMTPHLRRLIGLCLLAVAFGLVEVAAIPAATDGQGKKREPPTLLWNSYPLEQRPSTTDQVGAQIHKPPVPAQTSARQDDFPTPALVGGFILLLAAAVIVFTPWRRRRQQLREVDPEVVGEPRAQALQPPTPQSAADLLESLQLKSPSPPTPEQMPEVVAIWLEEARPGRSSDPVQRQPAKQGQLRETSGPLGEERVTEAEGSLESQLELELWTRIADVDLVPVPGPKPQTREELPPP
jgi:hypothetical protein